MRCPETNQLRAYEHGDVSAEVAKHIANCATCQANLGALPDWRDERACEVGEAGRSVILSTCAGQVLGNYELLRLLGRGGLGEVWLGRDRSTHRECAIKVLRDDRVRPDLLRRFREEIRASVERVKDPNVVLAFDCGEHDGRCFLVMEYLDGWSLARVLTERGRLEIADACAIVYQAAVGLHAIHREGLVHRDLKLANLFLTREGKVKVIDLGLARLRDGTGDGDTAPGMLLGSITWAPCRAPSTIWRQHGKVTRRRPTATMPMPPLAPLRVSQNAREPGTTSARSTSVNTRFAAGPTIARHATLSAALAIAPRRSGVASWIASNASASRARRCMFTNLNLGNATLAVINGCESGMVKPDAVDEYVGLPSGLLFAGATCVVSSLWEVYDLSSALLIGRFHEELLSGKATIAEALHAAQRWLRHEIRTGPDLRDRVLPPLLEGVDAATQQGCLAEAERMAREHPDSPPFASPVHWAPFVATGLAYRQ